MAPRSNLKQCIRLLTSRLESTSEFIALNLVMKDEVLGLKVTFNILTHAPFKPSPILYYQCVPSNLYHSYKLWVNAVKKERR